MNILLILPLIVFLLMIFPVRKRLIDFDEKGEAIKIYHEEVYYINSQYKNGFITANEKDNLLIELDKKSVLAITAIDKKRYSYHRSLITWLIISISLLLSAGFYYSYYRQSGVMHWQNFNERFASVITKGLFDNDVASEFIAKEGIKSSNLYCFAMQSELLKKYDTNSDALANLANCFLQTGYLQLAKQAIDRGMTDNSENTQLNYLMAEHYYLKNNKLDKENIARLTNILQYHPNHFKVIRLLAINSLNQGDYLQARFFFTKLKELVPNNNKKLTLALDSLLGRIGVELKDKKSSSTIKTKEKTPPIKKSSNKPISIKVNIKVSTKLAKNIKGPSVLFIVIKSTSGQLLMATKNILKSPDKPLSLIIADNQSGAMQVQSIQGHKQVTIIARISRNNSPMATSGDLTSPPLLVDLPQNKDIELIIDRELP